MRKCKINEILNFHCDKNWNFLHIFNTHPETNGDLGPGRIFREK